MPTDEFKLYLEEKFSNLNEKLDTINATTQKTNGRVNDHDVRINNLEITDVRHYLDCPMIPKMEKMNEDLMEYKVIKKYPKLSIAILVLFGLSTLAIILGQVGVI